MGVRRTFAIARHRLVPVVPITVACTLLAGCASGAATTQGSATTRVPAITATHTSPTTNPARPSGTRGNGGGRLAVPSRAEVPPVQIKHASLTTENWATYDYSVTADSVTATAPADLTDVNVREVFWRTDAVPARDQQTCTTWSETTASVDGGPIQPGLAMRIASVGRHNEGLRAITVTENVIYAGAWMFNVHVWDTTRPVPMTMLRTFDVSKIVGRLAVVDGHVDNLMAKPPWHVCGRTEGSTFSFKVWTGDNPEPSWNDPTRVFRVTLPAGWDYSGFSGGYIGHLRPGQFATATAEPATTLSP